ncbi:MAG: hypothetical protein ACPGU7_10620 [Gammaproteobacteria bacterium]
MIHTPAWAPLLKRATLILGLCLPAFTTSATDLSTADRHGLAKIAPQGRWINQTELRLSGFDHWYNNQGDRERLGADYDGLALDAGVFPILGLLGPGASLGTSSLEQSVRVERLEISLGYGVTRDLTAGFILPLGHVCSEVSVSTGGATVGSNPLFNPNAPITGGNFPFAPAGGPIAPLDTAGAVNVLTDPTFGLSYKAPEKRCYDTWGDPTLGVLWRAWGSDSETLIIGAGVRLGLAEADDPDDLFDVPLSDGSTDAVLRIQHFRDWGDGWDTWLNFEFNAQFEDSVTRRVPTGPTDLLPAAASRRDLDRDLGDWFQADAELGRSFGNWRLSGTAHFYRKGSDEYSLGPVRIAPLEKDTHQIANQWRAAISWSGAEAYRAGTLPLPLAVKLETQQTLGGTNMPDIWDWYLTVSTVF